MTVATRGMAFLVPLALLLGAVTVIRPIWAIAGVGAVLLLGVALTEMTWLLVAALTVHMVFEQQRWSNVPVSLAGINVFPNDLLTLGLAAGFGWRWVRSGRVPAWTPGRIGIALLLFLGYGVFSLIRSLGIHGWSAIPSFRLQFFYALLYPLSYLLLAEETSRRRVGQVVLVSGFIVALQGIWNLATGHPVGARTSSGTLRYLSGLQALTAVFALAVLSGWVWTRRRPIWSLALGGLLGTAILLSQARSVWLGGLIGLAVAGLASVDMRRHGGKLILLAGLVALLLIVTVPRLAHLPVLGEVTTRLTSLESLDQDATSIWRLVVWGAALLELSRSPALGLGLGKPFAWFDVVRGDWDRTSQMHNSYLELAYYTGAIGAGLLILFQLLVLAETLGAARRNSGTPLGARLRGLAACQVCLAAVAFTNVIGSSMTAATFSWILGAISIREARIDRLSDG